MGKITYTPFAIHNNTEPYFRAWCQVIHDRMIEAGFVQTADTGQIDLTTVLAPSGNNQKMGYEIFRSNDAGGSLVEFYVKLEYGSGGASSYPSTWVSVGWATDGAGTLTSTNTNGMSNASGTIRSHNGSAVSTYTWYLCGGSGFFVNFATIGSTTCFGFSIERTRGIDHAFQNEVLLISQSSSELQQIVCSKDNGAIPFEPHIRIISGSLNSTIVNGQVGLGLHFAYAGRVINPSMSWLGVRVNHLGSSGNIISVTIYGETHYYIILPQSSSGGNYFYTSNDQILMRYE